jgi:two-component system OmpR family response regulator
MNTVNKAHVLAIDEEPEVRVRIAEVLEQAGYGCLCVATAGEARSAAELTSPDLIIASVNLTGQSGITVCEQLKRQSDLIDVPVMFLSAAQVPDVIHRQCASGGAYFLRKPFHASALLQLVERTRLVRPVEPIPAASAARILDGPKATLRSTSRVAVLAAK